MSLPDWLTGLLAFYIFDLCSVIHWAINIFQAELIDPAVKGTLNVLGSCARASTIKKVVLTSSMAAVAYNGKPRTPDVVVDETWWSHPDICREMKVGDWSFSFNFKRQVSPAKLTCDNDLVNMIVKECRFSLNELVLDQPK